MNKTEALTGRVTSEMTAAQPETPTPQLEAGLRHALPLGTNVLVSGGKGVVTSVLIGRLAFLHYRNEIRLRLVVLNGGAQNCF